jgi:8-oxo-dGTP pyrophosphatase MutT (NUDIX family)
MNTFYRLYVHLGILGFWVLLPIERFFLRRTHRVYALILKDNKIILTKSWLSDGKWALPGGGIAGNETSEEALWRELKEEINIVPTKNLKFISSGRWQNHDFGFKYDLFAVEEDPEFSINRKLEITDVAWVDIASLGTHNTASDIVAILKNYK